MYKICDAAHNYIRSQALPLNVMGVLEEPSTGKFGLLLGSTLCECSTSIPLSKNELEGTMTRQTRAAILVVGRTLHQPEGVPVDLSNAGIDRLLQEIFKADSAPGTVADSPVDTAGGDQTKHEEVLADLLGKLLQELGYSSADLQNYGLMPTVEQALFELQELKAKVKRFAKATKKARKALKQL